MNQIDITEKKLLEIRKIGREAIYKIIIFLSSLLAVSFSLISSNFINFNINETTLVYSWEVMIWCIFSGFIVLFLEPRIEYAKEWRYYQLPKNSFYSIDALNNSSLVEKIKITFYIIISFLLPQNNLLDKKHTDKTKITIQEILSIRLLKHLSKIQKLIFLIELTFFILFLISLYIFIKSFT